MTSTAGASRPASASRQRRRPRRAGALDRWLRRGLLALEQPEAPYLVLVAGFTLAGLALRLNGLSAQGLWFDEADVVMQAQQGFWSLLANIGAAGQNGPLYTLFLHAWTALLGTSEAAVRLPSVLAGTAAIPLIYTTGRALHGPKLGLYAAGIVAVAPYQQWYAQEAKMYALAVCATLASTYLFILALRDNRRAHWLGYVAVTTVALYLHVTAALVLVAQAAYYALAGRQEERGARTGDPLAGGERGAPATEISAPRTPTDPVPRSALRAPRSSRRGWLALAALTLPYLPLGLWELRFLLDGTETWHRPIAPLEFLRVSFTRFAVNRAENGDTATEWRGLAVFGALALAGALPLAWRHRPWPAPAFPPRRRSALLVLLVALPMLLFYAVTLLRPLFSDRYLIVVTPAFYLLAAGGLLAIERFARWLAPVALALILAVVWVPLRDVNLAAASAKEDWRGAYTHVVEHLHPRDVVIVHPGYLYTTLDYYRLRELGDGRLASVPLVTIPAEYTDGTLGGDRLDLYLQQRTHGFERVWVVLSPDRLPDVDPEDRLRSWYHYNARLIDERRFNGVWLGLYTYSRPFGTAYYPPPAVRTDLAFASPAGPVALIGYGFDLYPDESAVRPGGTLPLVLRWVFPGPETGRLAIRWQLRDARGNEVAGGLSPLLGGRPFRPWDFEKRDDVWDYHDLPLPATLPPGDYQLAIECVPLDAQDRPLEATRAGQPLPAGPIALGWITVRP